MQIVGVSAYTFSNPVFVLKHKEAWFSQNNRPPQASWRSAFVMYAKGSIEKTNPGSSDNLGETKVEEIL